ncbi:hypothetical protein [Chitinolyticbacter meiyuanensis]|uniref:hypothetical protein n=1 Tax=Chitinolyticbacter meiyuanensis TaxID=682798 RepID=UPI0011E603F8|nr:hypothetical protein [Chitinolyticbacter meiyuanensis]
MKPYLQWIALTLALTSALACAETDPWQRYDQELRTLPKDASVALDRGVNCNHFAGEFNGDGSAHDKEVNKTMAQLRCDTISGM